MNYKGFEIGKTETTTDTVKIAFGKNYNSISYLYEIVGLKPVGKMPLIISIRAAKQYINDYLNPEDYSQVEIPELDYDEISKIYDEEYN